MRGLVVSVGAAVGLLAVAGPAMAVEYLPEQSLDYRFSEYYVGINWTGLASDAINNCRNDARTMNGGAYVVTCTATVYGARMDVYQQV